MEHTEIRRTLSAYLDDAVSPEERVRVEEHLAGCAVCREALADLERTVAHLKSLPEVEPPPWLSAKIMAQVREAAEKKPTFWQRFFLPFQVKLPLQAFALLFLCVTGYYLARTNAPLMELTAPATREDSSTSAPAPAPATAPATAPAPTHAPTHAPAHAPAPATAQVPPLPLESKPQLSAKAAAPKALAPEKRMLSEMPSLQQPLGLFGNAPDAQTHRPALAPPSATHKPLAQSKKAESSEFSAKAFDAAAPGAASGGSGTEQPPQQEQSRRREELGRPEQMEVTLKVGDTEGAVKAIEEAVTRHGGRIVRRSYGEESHSLLVRMETARVPKLMDRLVRIGTPGKAPQLPTGNTESVELTIRW